MYGERLACELCDLRASNKSITLKNDELWRWRDGRTHGIPSSFSFRGKVVRLDKHRLFPEPTGHAIMLNKVPRKSN